MHLSIQRLVIAPFSRAVVLGSMMAAGLTAVQAAPGWAESTQPATSCPESETGVAVKHGSSMEGSPSSCEPPPKPVLQLNPGVSLRKAFGLDDWFSVSVSALSQNNGTTAGLTPSQFTSSNLFNLGFQVGPFTRTITESPKPSDEVPRLGLEKVRSNHFMRKVFLNALFTQRAGDILSDDIPNQLNTQWNYGNGPIARLNILNLEYSHPEGLLSTIKLGKLMQAQDFTVNPIQCFFANFGLCGWAQATPAMVDIPGNPFNSYGAVIKLGQSSKTRLKYGVYQLAPSTFAPKYHGLDFRFDQAIGTAHFLELNVPLSASELLPATTDSTQRHAHPSRLEDANSLYESPLPPTTLTLGGWLANGKFTKIQSPGSPAQYASQNNAIYGIASVKLPIQGLGMDHRLFASTSLGLSPDVQKFHSGGNAGLVIAGAIPARPFDTLSVGMAYANYNSEYYLQNVATNFVPGTEVALELNYNIALNKSVSIMPNYQYIIHAAGNTYRSGVSVAGVQVWLRF